jgi:hypothetical protein
MSAFLLILVIFISLALSGESFLISRHAAVLPQYHNTKEGVTFPISINPSRQ